MMQKPTSGAAWRVRSQKLREEGALLDFPSGLTARIRNVSNAGFLKMGGIPDTLTPIVMELMSSLGSGIDKARMAKAAQSIPAETMLAVFTSMQDALCRLAFIDPKIVDEPQEDDEIAITDLDDEDKEWLFGLLGLPARQLETFCKESNERLRSLLERQKQLQQSGESDGLESLLSGADGDSGDGSVDRLSVQSGGDTVRDVGGEHGGSSRHKDRQTAVHPEPDSEPATAV